VQRIIVVSDASHVGLTRRCPIVERGSSAIPGLEAGTPQVEYYGVAKPGIISDIQRTCWNYTELTHHVHMDPSFTSACCKT